MTRVAAAVDPVVLERILRWAKGIEDFEEHHAHDGVFLGSAFRHDGLPENADADFLVGLCVTFWFWFDDRSDRFRCDADTYDTLIALGSDPSHRTTKRAPEIAFFERLGDEVKQRCGSAAEHAWWLMGSAIVFRGMLAERVMSRAGAAPSYAEALEAGADSSTLPSILPAANVAHRMDRAARASDQRLARAERYMCLSQRLLNDLVSADKERREGHAGRVSNIALLLEGSMSRGAARAFVEAQLHGYERLMSHELDLLGPGDDFARLIRHSIRNIRRWYALGPARYGSGAEGGAA
ncbi:terpene synthase family protein [Polyangium aurulentum]|uniref:terpene synthase family protein n=1 Tax=Polyangium aurulentum TaxID=2567896 RepID=UPI0010ADB3D4|nr:terpene synthase family protein [Polyangium aurulentum]UQA56523.1 terpene synthase family protein [Polyangium aurulentum]